MGDDAAPVRLIPVVRAGLLFGVSFAAFGAVSGVVIAVTAKHPVPSAVLIFGGAVAYMLFELFQSRKRRTPEELAALSPPPHGVIEPWRRELLGPAVVIAMFTALLALWAWWFDDAALVLASIALGSGSARLYRVRRFARWERVHARRLLAVRGAADDGGWYAVPAGVAQA